MCDLPGAPGGSRISSAAGECRPTPRVRDGGHPRPMASSPQTSTGIIAGINVTPLVDIMLVLLIIFLVTARLVATPPSGIKLDLPRSSTGESVQVVFAVSLPAEGQASVNGQPLASDEEILALARQAHDTHPDLRAVVQADGKVLHERVVHAVDLLSRAGVSQIAFGVTLSAAPGDRPR